MRVLRNLFREKKKKKRPVSWVVYDHPARHPLMFPDLFVARKWIGDRPTNDLETSGSYRELLLKLPPQMVRRDPLPSDEPDVLEVWQGGSSAAA